MRRVPLAERIQRRTIIDPATGCWLWQGCIDKRKGYGKIGLCYQGKITIVGTHRVSYETFVGPIPDGLELDHLCRVRHCVNPEHLEPVTHAENVARALRTVPTHCIRGHAFDEANTHYAKSQRVCRACSRIKTAKHRAKKKALAA